MIRQIWNHPKEGELQLKIYAHITHEESIDQTLIKQLNELEEEEALWYLRKIKEPWWINANGHQEIDLEMTITTLDMEQRFDVKALLDSGCMSSAISKRFIKEHQINTIKLPHAITATNADGTINAGGKIMDMVRLKVKIQDHEETMELTVADIRKKDIFIGHDWLQHHNPEIDWQDKKIKFSRCPGVCYQTSEANEPEDKIDENRSQTIELDDEQLLAIKIGQPKLDRFKIRAKSNFATDIAEANQEKQTWEEIVPKHYLPYKEVFEKQTFDQLPPRRPWDHAIELIPNAKMMDCKIYLLNPTEQKQLDEVLKEQLETGRIKSSKSPMASPFFSAKKKDGKL